MHHVAPVATNLLTVGYLEASNPSPDTLHFIINAVVASIVQVLCHLLIKKANSDDTPIEPPPNQGA